MRNSGCAHSPVQPEPGCGRTDGGEAPPGGAEPGRPGGPRRDPPLGGVFPGKGLCRPGGQCQGRCRYRPVCRRRPGAAAGQAGGLGRSGPGGPHRAGHGAWHPQRGQIHLYQQGGPSQDRPGRGPARRHPQQAVGAGGQHSGAAGHPGDPVAPVRRPGGRQASGLHRRHQGRCGGHGGAGLLPDGLPVPAICAGAGGAV